MTNASATQININFNVLSLWLKSNVLSEMVYLNVIMYTKCEYKQAPSRF